MHKEQQRLRVHHLLCIPLFRGAGYSDGFSKNMAEKIAWLKAHPEEEVELVCGPDMICSHCPNCNPDETCGSDGNHVGICVGFLKNGEPLIAHCSATQNKVVVSTCGSEFKYFRRPCSVLTAN